MMTKKRTSWRLEAHYPITPAFSIHSLLFLSKRKKKKKRGGNPCCDPVQQVKQKERKLKKHSTRRKKPPTRSHISFTRQSTSSIQMPSFIFVTHSFLHLHRPFPQRHLSTSTSTSTRLLTFFAWSPTPSNSSHPLIQPCKHSRNASSSTMSTVTPFLPCALPPLKLPSTPIQNSSPS